MKRIIILGAIITFLALSLVVSIKYIVSIQQERTRWKNNAETLILKQSVALELTNKEYKRLYHNLDSLGKELGVKHLQNVTVINYHFKDSTITKANTTINTETNTLSFTASKECYSVSGMVKDNEVYINDFDFKDTLTSFIYQTRPDWFWGMKKFWKKKQTTAKVYSVCRKDTIAVARNIKIINN